MELYEKYRTLFKSYHVDSPLRIAHFMAQIEHESDLEPKEEILNYSVARLMAVWPKRFPNIETAKFYAYQPAMIANRAYADRMGNGNEKSGDGYKYRGRGFIQLTGKYNYILATKDTRIDFVTNPDLLLLEPNSMVVALWYWNKNKLNVYADKDDCDGVSDVINIGHHTPKIGDAIGYKARKALVEKWKLTLKEKENGKAH